MVKQKGPIYNAKLPKGGALIPEMRALIGRRQRTGRTGSAGRIARLRTTGWQGAEADPDSRAASPLLRLYRCVAGEGNCVGAEDVGAP